MSKTKKFLSIALALLKEKDGDSSLLSEMNADRLEQAVGKIRTEQTSSNHADARESGTDQEDLRQKVRDGQGNPTGQLEIMVLQGRNPCCAQVKLFPLKPGEKPENFSRVNGRIDMLREVTGDNGKLSLTLKEGLYAIEVSKGSEYGIVSQFVSVIKNEKRVICCELVQYVNLKEWGWYAGDLHHHSIFSSPVYGGTDEVTETPEEVCRSMRAMGALFGALSDHHNILNHRVWSKQCAGGFVPICSKEISTSNGHVLALGVLHDVIYRIPEEKERTDACLREEFVRVTKEIRESGGLAQLNHPKDESSSISWNPEFDDLLPIFDTMEIWNGSHPMCGGTINAQAGELWRNLLDQGIFIPATTGSDTHNCRADDYHLLMGQLMQQKEKLFTAAEKERNSYEKEREILSEICTKVLPFLEEWAETSLTSAGVRTYVKTEGDLTPQAIMGALKEGRSFLTNGPVLIPTISGKGVGETVAWTSGRLEIQVQIFSNHPLRQLRLYSRNGGEEVVELEKKKAAAYYCYELDMQKGGFEEEDYLFFVVLDSPLCMAMTNPIFIRKVIK